MYYTVLSDSKFKTFQLLDGTISTRNLQVHQCYELTSSTSECNPKLGKAVVMFCQRHKEQLCDGGGSGLALERVACLCMLSLSTSPAHLGVQDVQAAQTVSRMYKPCRQCLGCTRCADSVQNVQAEQTVSRKYKPRRQCLGCTSRADSKCMSTFSLVQQDVL